MNAEEAKDPSCVKVACSLDGHALYFSRSLLPYDRDGDCPIGYYKHIGLYAYRQGALEQFCRLPPSPLERAEKLEQLRFLENGIRIRVVDAPFPTIGVDTYDDLKKVEEIMSLTIGRA